MVICKWQLLHKEPVAQHIKPVFYLPVTAFVQSKGVVKMEIGGLVTCSICCYAIRTALHKQDSEHVRYEQQQQPLPMQSWQRACSVNLAAEMGVCRDVNAISHHHFPSATLCERDVLWKGVSWREGVFAVKKVFRLHKEKTKSIRWGAGGLSKRWRQMTRSGLSSPPPAAAALCKIPLAWILSVTKSVPASSHPPLGSLSIFSVSSNTLPPALPLQSHWPI